MDEITRVAQALHEVHCGCGDFIAHQMEARQQFDSDDTVYLAMARAAIDTLRPGGDRLPAITRPNGQPYRPRTLRVVGWDVDWPNHGDTHWQVAVLGTHDIAVARQLAPRGYHCPFLVNPTLGWMRLGMNRGEPTWMHDEIRGAACVIFDESDDPQRPAAAS